MVGISFGVVAEPLMGSVAPIVMSAIVFAGAAQFGATAVLAAGGSAATAIATGAMLNARFLPMGVAAAPALRGSRLRRALEGQAIVDASWALAARGEAASTARCCSAPPCRSTRPGCSERSSACWSAARSATPRRSASTRSSPPSSSACSRPSCGRPHAVPTVLIAGAIALALTPVLPAGLPVLLASCAALIGLRR